MGQPHPHGWVEREYWGIMKRLAPGIRTLIGEESSRLLETGLKAETEAFRDLMVPMLRARLKRAPPTRQRPPR